MKETRKKNIKVEKEKKGLEYIPQNKKLLGLILIVPLSQIMYGFLYWENWGLEWLLDDVWFIPNLSL